MPGSPKHSNNRRAKPKLAPPTTASDVALGMVTQLVKSYLFIEPKRRAICYLAVVFGLSLLADYYPLPNHYYWVQKHNVFNQFGPKIGWFWTTVLLAPFIWLTSHAHQGSSLKAWKDVVRLAVATGLWYFWTKMFMAFERSTQNCHGAPNFGRDDCHVQGGKWIPGFDISGHTFLLIYSALVTVEEALAFRNWPAGPRASLKSAPSEEECAEWTKRTRAIQWLFVALAVMVAAWEVQLVITLLYYHSLSHKMLAALIAALAWFLSYRVWYPVAFPFSPVRRFVRGKKK